MNDREKIIKIIEKNGTYNGRSLSFDYYVIQPDDLADALIAAGIGDVKEVKRKAFVYRKEIAHLDGILKSAEHRAEVYEEMFDILHEESGMDMKVFSKEWYKQRAEKELTEERKDG